MVNVPHEKPALLSGRDAQALNYLKVYADETTNDVEEEISHKPQPAPPLGKLTKNDVLRRYSNVFRPGRENPLGTPMQNRARSQSQASARPSASSSRSEAGQGK